MLKPVEDLIRKHQHIFFGGIILFLSISLVRNITAIQSGKKRIEEAKSRVQELESQKKDLERKLAETQSQEFVERQLRDKLNLAKSGEIVVILPSEDEVRKLAPNIPEEKEDSPLPNWEKWTKLFL